MGFAEDIARVQNELERLRAREQQLLESNNREVMRRRNAVRWAKKWKDLARFRGWPASRHEKIRRDRSRLISALTIISIFRCCEDCASLADRVLRGQPIPIQDAHKVRDDEAKA